MAHDNITLLTTSHSVVAAKKRAKHAQIKEIVFDEEARRSFLTGFHKRKVARREEAKKKTRLREKQERLELRREHRRALAERAARNAAEVERACGAFADGDGEEWGGVSSEPERMEEAYEGEEQLATVTIVQDFDLDMLRHGPPRPARDTETERGEARREEAKQTRRKKVRYETKAARRAERRKQLARRTEKAERAR